MKYILGIDTSCYTTSVAIMDEKGNLIADTRKILDVKPGKRGLQQSEMVFQHTRNLPRLLEEALAKVESPCSLQAVGVSAFPRPIANSYMPAFLVGYGYAKALALTHGVPLYELSHQENHVLAGVWSAKGPFSEEFLALHTSGGTTELVKVKKEGARFNITLLGGTLDISAGQFIDRVGVALGLPFPAGPHLEMLAQSDVAENLSIPFYSKDFHVSFSGAETFVKGVLALEGYDPAVVAKGVQLCVAKTLAKLILHGIKTTGLVDVLLVGGVISNQFIREHLSKQFSHEGGTKLYFPASRLSADNAVGAAFLACQQ